MMMDIAHWGHHLFLAWVTMLTAGVNSESLEVCPEEDLSMECSPGEVIVMESAHYGRMENGRCIEVNQYIGCDNDVLSLVDGWCSGLNQCSPRVPNNDLKVANTECLRFLKLYLFAEYYCVKVITPGRSQCSNQIPYDVEDSEGFISSHVTDETGCGTSRAPWRIQALPGQTIHLRLVDFSNQQMNSPSNETQRDCSYGYITENGKRTIFSCNDIREKDIYVSESNSVKIELSPESSRGSSSGFLIKYKKTGCPDLKPPAHAWYKRDGGQAVIGCEWSQKTWHLSCDGHSWSGVVGNCSEPATEKPVEEEIEIEMPSALLLTCVVSVAVVLAAVVLVCGVVCIKKFRIKHEIEKATTLPRQYGHYDMDPNIEMASMMYLPYKPCEHEGILVDVNPHSSAHMSLCAPPATEVSPIHIWQQPLPEVPDKPLSAAPTRQNLVKHGRTPGDGGEGVESTQENDTIRSGQSGFSSINGHSYSALNSNG